MHILKVLHKFQLLVLILAVVVSGFLFTNPAVAALTSDQVTEIEAVVATGNLAEIEAVTQKTVKDAISNGELPGDAAQQATIIVLKAAKEAGKDTTAVAKAANAGAISGAVSAAIEASLDAKAFAEAAMLGSNQGIAMVLGNPQTPMLEPEAFTRQPRGVTSMPGRTFLPPPTLDDRPASHI